jgi:hypothetical protein
MTLGKEPYTVTLKSGLALRIYPDTRPNNMKIAQIQKGLVLVLNEKELIEEGAGFGVPAAIFSDRTCFSSSAETLIIDKVQSKIVIKRYRMDTVSKKSWKNIVLPEIPIQRFISDKLENAYHEIPFIRKFFFPAVDTLKKIGVKMFYKRIKSRGEIIVTYDISENYINIKADLCRLNRTFLKKIVLLNEQGSTFFRKFSSNGSILVDDQIGAWRLLTANRACFSDLEGSLGFCLRNLHDYRSFVGREYLNGFLSWVGLEYEAPPDQDFLEYEIKIIRNNEL